MQHFSHFTHVHNLALTVLPGPAGNIVFTIGHLASNPMAKNLVFNSRLPLPILIYSLACVGFSEYTALLWKATKDSKGSLTGES